MEYKPPAEQIMVAVKALRYTLAYMDELDRQEAGGSPADAPGVSMTVDEALALAPSLALLLVSARQELAGRELLTNDPAEQNRGAREELQRQLEALEITAAFAGVDAEMEGDGG
jgi:hypothetical protein